MVEETTNAKTGGRSVLEYLKTAKQACVAGVEQTRWKVIRDEIRGTQRDML